jgi:hypothetical protein
MRKVIHGSTYNGYDLNCSWKNHQGYYVEILQALECLLNYMTQKHSRVYFTRFDLTYPANSAYPNDNVLFSGFLDALIHYYKYKDCDPKYLWVREQSTTGQAHYHLILVLDPKNIYKAWGILTKVTQLWQGCLGIENGKGLVQLCPPEKFVLYEGVRISRDAKNIQEVLRYCFEWGSYLAKRYSKGESPAYVNQFGCSQIPKEYLS